MPHLKSNHLPVNPVLKGHTPYPPTPRDNASYIASDYNYHLAVKFLKFAIYFAQKFVDIKICGS